MISYLFFIIAYLSVNHDPIHPGTFATLFHGSGSCPKSIPRRYSLGLSSEQTVRVHFLRNYFRHAQVIISSITFRSRGFSILHTKKSCIFLRLPAVTHIQKSQQHHVEIPTSNHAATCCIFSLAFDPGDRTKFIHKLNDAIATR